MAVAHRWELLQPGRGIAVGSEVYLLAAAAVVIPPAAFTHDYAVGRRLRR